MSFVPLTKDQLLDLIRKIFPADYVVTIEQEGDGRGWDVFAQQAEQLSRAAQAIDTTTQAYYLRYHSTETNLPSSGGVKATGQVTLTRSPPLAGDINLSLGTLISSFQKNVQGKWIEGPIFQLMSDVTLPAGSTSPVTANVQCVREGYQGNMPAGRLSEFTLLGRALVEGASITAANTIQDQGIPDRFTEAMVGRYIEFLSGANATTYPRKILTAVQGTTTTITVDGPALTFPDTANIRVLEYADLNIAVEQQAATTGGKNAFLDAIGRDRNMGRVAGESDDAYRLRLSYLSDIISPGAIERICARILSPLGIPYRILETRDPNGLFGFIYDLDPFDYGTISDGQVLLSSICGSVRFFLVMVGLGNQGEFGAPYDATNSPNPNAWDEMFFDGEPVEYLSTLAALYRAVDAARAAGICWELLLDPTL